MTKRKRRRQKLGNPRESKRPGTPPDRTTPWFRSGAARFGAAVTVAASMLALTLWLTNPSTSDDPGKEPPSGKEKDRQEAAHHPKPDLTDFRGVENPHAQGSGQDTEHKPGTGAKKDPGNFLEAFNKASQGTEGGSGGAALSNEELENQFKSLEESNHRLEELKRRVTSGFPTDAKGIREAFAERDRLIEQINRKSAALEKEVGKARRARADDPVPQWLTGELLILINGEPEHILPYLQFAVDHKLKRPRLLGSLARVLVETNRFEDAYRIAGEALDQDSQNRYVWNAFIRAAFSTEHFAQVSERLERAFPSGPPDWAAEMGKTAADLQEQWQAEQKLRLAEAKADDLPRVRLVIEHRRFKGVGDSGSPTVESTGREEIILELFENEAPVTVANFLDLVESGFYNGTKFHLAVAGLMVEGGDPNTKNDDPTDDEADGPDFVIPDEFGSPKARHHFRGSLSMVSLGPHTTSTRFFMTLAPQPGMDGHCTVFGRILKGQEVADRITPGRTSRRVGRFGRIIPGDLLVRAETIRKRSHKYRVIREKPDNVRKE
jgi:cyclophilin family peptidyl-prolyl cis-trans isomerase